MSGFRWRMACVVALVAALACAAPASAVTINIDGQDAGPVYDGLGAMSVAGSTKLLFDYPAARQTEILDYLFCNPGVTAASGFCTGGRYAAALQRLKVEIGSDENAEIGAEPTIERTKGTVDCSVGWEFKLMTAAKQRNPNIKFDALAWGYPAWINPGGGTNYDRVFSQDTIDYLLHYLGCAASNGTPIDTLGIWNEINFLGDVKAQSEQWIADLRAALDTAGYSSVKLIVDDGYNWSPMNICAAPTTADDRDFCDATAFFANHYPGVLNGQVPVQWYHQSNVWSAPGYKGTWGITENAGDSATFTFSGTQIKWIGATLWNMGKADVYVDGALEANDVDLYSPLNDPGGSPPEGGHYQQVLFSKTGMANTQHTIKIVATGDKNASSGGTWINVDAFGTDGTPLDASGPCSTVRCVDDANPHIGYNAAKPIIAGEDSPGLYDTLDGVDYYHNPLLRGDWAGSRYAAQKFNTNYLESAITGSVLYTLISSYYDQAQYAKGGVMTADMPWLTTTPSYKLQARAFTVAHYTQFTHPGSWRYVGDPRMLSTGSCYLGTSACNVSTGQTGSYVTLRSISGSSYAIVAETKDATSAQSVTFCLTGGLSTGTVHVWKTDASAGMTNVANLTPSGGCFTHSLAANAQYTFTDQSTGQTGSPTSGFSESGLPLPYDETFQSYGSTKTQPKYFIDQFGAFETGHSCPTGGAARCLRQVVGTRPIRWGLDRDKPYTLIGDLGWTNYEVQTHATGSVGQTMSLLGRVQRSQHDFDFSERARYEAQLTRSGTSTWNWRLWRVGAGHSYTSLASGSVSGSAWVTAKLRMSGSTITLRVNNAQVASVTDSTYSGGMAGLATTAASAGNTFDTAYFDRFCAQAVGASTCPPA
jgi:glycosyl hydrolase family 59/glycosyl hydrolase family 59 (putative galactocerebrosidase)